MTDVTDSGKNRREHARSAVRIPFYCYVDGQRFDSEAIDLSWGGAFLRTDDHVRLSAPVLLLPKSAKSKKPLVLVVGHVVRQQREPPRGLGVRWAKIVSRGGVAVILKLASFVPAMFPEELPAPTRDFAELDVVGYSFKTSTYFVPDLAGSSHGKSHQVRPEDARAVVADATRSVAAKAPLHMAPPPARSHRVETHHELKSPTSYWGLDGEVTKVAPAAPGRGHAAAAAPPPEVTPEPTARPDEAAAQTIATSDRLSRTTGIGPLTETLAYDNAQIPVAIKVELRFARKKLDAVLLRIGMSDCFVTCPSDVAREMAPDERVDVKLTIDLHSRTHEVTLCCRLMVAGLDPRTDREGLALTIKGVEQPGSPGLYERYVKYLYYQLINRA